MEILYTVIASEVEVGDLILIDGERMEVTNVGDTPDDTEGVRLTVVSHDEGESNTIDVCYDERIDVWSA